MKRVPSLAARPCFSWCFFLLFATAQPGSADSSEFGITRIEEDWELVVATPETNINSPQATCAMSPAGTEDLDFLCFELNFQSQPAYASGGLHLLAWHGEYLRGLVHTQPAVPIQQATELVRWTQSLTLANGTLTYEISNGSSTTWGAFGTGELKLVMSTNLSNLYAYRVAESLEGSGVGFGANRVSSMVLKRVRFITNSGYAIEVNINHDVLNPNDE